MRIKNPVLFFLFIGFFILNILDIISTLFILKAESNPLYHLFGNIYVPFFIKLVIVFFVGYIIYRNKYQNNYHHYIFVLLLLFGSMVLMIAVGVNTYAAFHPEQLIEASKASTTQKISSYSQFMTIFYVVPVLFCFLAFWIYEKSRKHAKIDFWFYKKRKWWNP